MSSRYDERRHERIARRLEELRAWRNAREHPIVDWSFTAGGTSTSLTLGDFWPVVATPVQFAASGDVPEAWAGEPVELELWLGGEGFVRLSTGFQAGLDPFHHRFPIIEQRGAASGSRSRRRSCRRGCSAATSPSRGWSGPTSSFPTPRCGRSSGI